MDPRTVDEVLARVIAEGGARAAALGAEHVRLWEALADATRGGKRFRPALVTATHDALGGTCAHAAVEVAAAVELLHTAFVIHDDVIDGDDTRRGRPNVSGTFRARAAGSGASPEAAVGLGRTAGILAGDLAIAAAVRVVATCGAPPDVVARLLDLVDVALHATAAGELSDVLLSLATGTATVADSLAMEEQKTSAYSFSLPLQLGATLAGADAETVARLDDAGRSLGVAFQLADDLIGVFGDPAVTGKSTTSDLRSRKQTPLLARARTTEQWPQIEPYVGRDLGDAELDEVRALLTSCGARGFVEELAASHLAAARAVVVELGIPLEEVAGLAGLTAAVQPAKEVAA